MKYQIIYILLVVLISCNINLVNCDAESKAISIIKDYQDIPRYTYFTTDRHLEKYPKGFCGGSTVENCDWKKYAEAIILLSGVTLIIALVTLIFGVVFWIFRGFLFGGCKPTHGVLCPGPRYDPDIGEGYSTRNVWILKIVVFILVIGCIPLFIVSITGNTQTTTNVKDLGNVIIDKADQILEQMSNFSSDLSNPKFKRFESEVGQIKSQLDNLIVEGTAVRNHGEDVSDYTDKFNGIRNDIVLAGFIVGMVAIGVLAVSALCNLPKFSCYAALALIILIPFTWIVFSAHYPINSFLADVCISYNTSTLISNSSTSTTSSTSSSTQFSNFANPLILEVIADCNVNQTNVIPVFKGMVDLVNTLETNGEQLTCQSIDFLCNNLTYPYYANYDYNVPPTQAPVMVCPAGVTCSTATLNQFLTESVVKDTLFGCKYLNTTQYCNLALPPTDCINSNGDQIITCNYNDVILNTCPTSCANTAYQTNSSFIVEGVNTLVALSDLWTDRILPVIRCSNLIPFVDEVQDIVCVKEVNSLTLLVAPSGIFAIFLTILGIFAVLGQKRFNSKARVKKNISRESA